MLPRICVIGSLNIDWIAQVAQLPQAGETVAAHQVEQRFGGKGANQALAASRQKCQVSMIGCVGNDANGRDYLQYLQQANVQTAGIAQIDQAPTGTAMIAVDASAENLIIVAAGANGLLNAGHLEQHEASIAQAKVLILQYEISDAALISALQLAQKHRIRVVLNPSPFRDAFKWGDYPIHTLIVNAGEASQIFGAQSFENPQHIQEQLEEYAINRVIITQGAKPTLGITQYATVEIPSFPVAAVDTVGAGDAFTGAYASCLANREEFPVSIRYANAAGALTTLGPGAQESVPTHQQIQDFLKSFQLPAVNPLE